MPQMSPIWWTLMFILFLTTYMMYMTIIFFMKEIKNEKTMKMDSSKNIKKMNWKW